MDMEDDDVELNHISNVVILPLQKIDNDHESDLAFRPTCSSSEENSNNQINAASEASDTSNIMLLDLTIPLEKGKKPRKEKSSTHYSFEAKDYFGTKKIIEIQFESINPSNINRSNNISQNHIRKLFFESFSKDNNASQPTVNGFNSKELAIRSLAKSIALEARKKSLISYKESERIVAVSNHGQMIEIARELIAKESSRYHFLLQVENKKYLVNLINFGNYVLSMEENEEKIKTEFALKKELKKQNGFSKIELSSNNVAGMATILKQEFTRSSHGFDFIKPSVTSYAVEKEKNESTSIESQITKIQDDIINIRADISEIANSFKELKKMIMEQPKKRSRNRSRSRERERRR